MLNPSEKAYCRALDALGEKDYPEALHQFEAAGEYFANNREFTLLHEATRLLVAVRDELRTTGAKAGSTQTEFDSLATMVDDSLKLG